jgi:hypothetical protein
MSEPNPTVPRQLNVTIVSPDASERERERERESRRAECQFRSPTRFPSHTTCSKPPTSAHTTNFKGQRRESPAEAGPPVYQLRCRPSIDTCRSMMISHQRSVPGFPIPDLSRFITCGSLCTYIDSGARREIIQYLIYIRPGGAWPV